jgi:hypothetical protein
MPGQQRSRLFYNGTHDEVQLGDRVCIKRWFFREQYGTVCYLPGLSDPHPELENEDGKQWAIRLDDGTVLVMGYSPEDNYGQPKKNLVLVNRGSGGGLAPDEVLG